MHMPDFITISRHEICLTFLLLASLMIPALVAAVPPHPDVIEDFRARDEIYLLQQKALGMRVLGVDQGQRSFPTGGGTRNVLVILVGFSDRSLDPGSDPAFYEGIFEDNGGLTWRKYYEDMSNGALSLTFAVVDVGDAPNGYAYYGANSGSFDIRPGELVEWAVLQADALVDYASFDNDSDGKVDVVAVIHAGIGEEVAGLDDPDAIWSHRWTLFSAPNAVPQSLDGVTVDDYMIQPEFVEGAGDSTIGVFAHEFGHALGLPDLYDTSFDTDGIGEWGLMGGGSWLGPESNGSVPAPLSAWSRAELGWLTVETITAAAPAPAGAAPIPPAPSTAPAVRASSAPGAPRTANAIVRAGAAGFADNTPTLSVLGAAVGLAISGAVFLLALYLLIRQWRQRRPASMVFRWVFLLVSATVFATGCSLFNKHFLSAVVRPEGGGTILNSDDNTEQELISAEYKDGAHISLTATPADGYDFEGWSGDIVATSAAMNLALTSDLSLVANFVLRLHSVTVLAQPTGGGSVSLDPVGGSYSYGTDVTLTATASTGYVFDGWSGDASGTDSTVVLTVDADKAVTADFVLGVFRGTTTTHSLTDVETSYTVMKAMLGASDGDEYLLIENKVQN